MTNKKFIEEFLKKTNTETMVITGSYALYLHCQKNNLTFTREIKDLDIYLLNTKNDINKKFLKYNSYFNEFKIKNNYLKTYKLKNPDFCLDVFSNDYLLDTISPSDELIEKIHTKEGLYLKISKVEHIFMLKLLTRHIFREKELSDLKFILNNFDLDLDLCEKLYKKTYFKNIKFPRKKIINKELIPILLSFKKYICKLHSSSILNLDILPYSFLCNLISINKKKISQENYSLFTEINPNDSLYEIKKLSLYLISTKKITSEEIKTIFKVILKSCENIYDFNLICRILIIKSKYVGKALEQHVKINKILKILNKKRFLINYFKELNS